MKSVWFGVVWSGACSHAPRPLDVPFNNLIRSGLICALHKKQLHNWLAQTEKVNTNEQLVSRKTEPCSHLQTALPFSRYEKRKKKRTSSLSNINNPTSVVQYLTQIFIQTTSLPTIRRLLSTVLVFYLSCFSLPLVSGGARCARC